VACRSRLYSWWLCNACTSSASSTIRFCRFHQLSLTQGLRSIPLAVHCPLSGSALPHGMPLPADQPNTRAGHLAPRPAEGNFQRPAFLKSGACGSSWNLPATRRASEDQHLCRGAPRERPLAEAAAEAAREGRQCSRFGGGSLTWSKTWSGREAGSRGDRTIRPP